MIEIELPGDKVLKFKHLIIDFNGTLAVDGKLVDGVHERLRQLSQLLKIHVITADTFGTARDELSEINCRITILQPTLQDLAKEEAILKEGPCSCIAIGNGQNDVLMVDKAGLGIAVIEGEGASARLLTSADLVCKSIIEALDLLIHRQRLIATLRN